MIRLQKHNLTPQEHTMMTQPCKNRVDWSQVDTRYRVPEVSIGWLKNALGCVRLIDVRTARERVSDGYIAESEHHVLDTITSAARDWDRDRALVIMCRSGGRSARATQQLLSMGFSRVVSLAGGMNAWKDAGYKHP